MTLANLREEPLRDDVKRLGKLLGEVLQVQSGQGFYEQVEQVRHWSQRAVQGDAEAHQHLSVFLHSADPDTLRNVARAFGHFLNLANIAEQYHPIRLRRQGLMRTAGEDMRALLREALASGQSREHILAAVNKLRIELVLTAHPTEVTRRTLMQKQDEIADILARFHESKLTADEQTAEWDRLRRRIVAAWETDEIRGQRPSPVDEAKWGFATVENSIWRALPACLREFDRCLRDELGEGLALDATPIRMSSWMGGDRDGNPFVTHEVTAEVIALARWMACDLYLRDIDTLRADLSLSQCGSVLRGQVGEGSREPYRDWLKQIRLRLQATQAAALQSLSQRSVLARSEPVSAQPYQASQELWQDVRLCYDDLQAAGLGLLCDGGLSDTLRRIALFGFGLLRLDIRQESSRHADALAAITQYLGLGDYNAWDEPTRQQFLLQELASPRPMFPLSALSADAEAAFSDDVREVLSTFRMLANQPAESLGAYVISMAHQASDVLAVMVLQRKADSKHPLRVVPLFETYDDLARAPSCLQALWSFPIYRDCIQGQQEIMIGYSDSAKDAGFLAAAWAQYQAQESLAALAAESGIQLVFFHGRGGSVSRGGAPTDQALRSQPPGSVTGALRVTEQGEMIRMKFGAPAVAQHHLMGYLKATLETVLMPSPQPLPAWRLAMEQLSQDSMKHYRHQLRDDPDFIQYLRVVTPEPELQLLPLGSRPARRHVGGGIASLRAIPWVFAWTQIRLMLPAWLGVVSALRACEAATVSAMLKEWPFFASLIDMLDMVLAKSDAAIAQHYETKLTKDPALIALGERLRRQHQDLLAMLANVQEGPSWAERNPVLAQSIRLRSPYLLPLHWLQAELMQRRRALNESNSAQDIVRHDRALMVTMTGIVAGMRNTG